jgi:hypothetical protein
MNLKTFVFFFLKSIVYHKQWIFVRQIQASPTSVGERFNLGVRLSGQLNAPAASSTVPTKYEPVSTLWRTDPNFLVV